MATLDIEINQVFQLFLHEKVQFKSFSFVFKSIIMYLIIFYCSSGLWGSNFGQVARQLPTSTPLGKY